MLTNTAQNDEQLCVPIFLHMTKTAGGTLKNAIENSPELKTVFISNQSVNNGSIDPEAFNSCQLFYGHSIFGVHNALNVQPLYYTFIRHPVRRAISHYYHLFDVDSSSTGDKIRTEIDINAFFKNCYHWEFDNFMCRILSGDGNSSDIEIQDIYEKAICNIDSYFNYIGFQEFFPESVQRLSNELSSNITVNQNVNIGKYDRSTINSETYSAIKEMNEHDMALYKYCVNKFL